MSAEKRRYCCCLGAHFMGPGNALMRCGPCALPQKAKAARSNADTLFVGPTSQPAPPLSPQHGCAPAYLPGDASVLEMPRRNACRNRREHAGPHKRRTVFLVSLQQADNRLPYSRSALAWADDIRASWTGFLIRNESVAVPTKLPSFVRSFVRNGSRDE